MKKKLLIVDDDKSIGEMLRTLLEFSGYQANVLNNPEGVEQKIREYDVDLVILDMRLGGISGTDVCTRLKEKETTKEVPILMMSALSDADVICKAAGADEFISKPFEMDELLAKINAVLVA